MADLHTLLDFLEPVNMAALSEDEGYRDTQLGKHVAVNDEFFPDIEHADIVLVGCGEARGQFVQSVNNEAPDAIRKQFYNLFHWHKEVQVADIGNIKTGASLNDTMAALRTVVNELISHNKR